MKIKIMFLALITVLFYGCKEEEVEEEKPISPVEISMENRSYLFTFDDNVDPLTEDFGRWQFNTGQQYASGFAWTRDDAEIYFGTSKDSSLRMFAKKPNDTSAPLARLSDLEIAPGSFSGYSIPRPE